ncbi:MAG: hypothetical protein U9R79_02870 [Armatimonadota bacterium]|nr:hypothetical protein [Armatimonadota bacterium]
MDRRWRWDARRTGFLLVAILLLGVTIWWLCASAYVSWRQDAAVARLRGQYVAYEGQIVSWYRKSDVVLGTIEITEGPFEGMRVQFGGITRCPTLGVGAPVVVSGYVTGRHKQALALSSRSVMAR